MKILLFGEILFDEINGKSRLGGAPLNLAARLAGLGADTYLISRVGMDDQGSRALREIAKLNIHRDFIQIDKTGKTGKTIARVNKDGIPDYEILNNTAYDNIKIDKAALDKISKINFDCLGFGTLAQRQKTSRDSLDFLFGKIMAKEIFCDLNLRQKFFSKNIIINSLRNTTILKLNREEAGYLNNLLYRGKHSIKKLAAAISNAFKIKIVLITRGKNGCFAYSRRAQADLPGIKTKIADTIGAGDAFSAGFLFKYLKTHNLKKSCEFANRLGARAAGQSGAI